MVKNPHLLEQLKRDILAREEMSFKKALKIFEAMWEEAVHLKRLPPKAPLEGMERVLKIAQIVNSCSKDF